MVKERVNEAALAYDGISQQTRFFGVLNRNLPTPESPINPTMRVLDIQICSHSRRACIVHLYQMPHAPRRISP